MTSLSAIGPVMLVGAGKMGIALATGWLEAALPASNLVLVDPAPGEQAKLLAPAYEKKMLMEGQCAEINLKLTRAWPDIVNELKEIMISTNALERAFIHSGVNTKPEQINLPPERYRFAVDYAHLTRERFTFLDLAAMNIMRPR